MTEPNYRLADLGRTIWEHVQELQSHHLAARYGAPNLKAESSRRIAAAEVEIWGDLQTLFRGGVFPDDPELVAAWETLKASEAAEE